MSLIGLGLLLAAPAAKEPPKKNELPSIVGNWDGQSEARNGKAAQGFPAGEFVFEFTAEGKFLLSRRGKLAPEGKYKADASAEPAEVDFNIGGGDKFHKCIYKIEKDVLTLCWDDGGGARPKMFGTAAGTKLVVMTFKRVEQKKK